MKVEGEVTGIKMLGTPRRRYVEVTWKDNPQDCFANTFSFQEENEFELLDKVTLEVKLSNSPKVN